jgi:hypothetical protein
MTEIDWVAMWVAHIGLYPAQAKHDPGIALAG